MLRAEMAHFARHDLLITSALVDLEHDVLRKGTTCAKDDTRRQAEAGSPPIKLLIERKLLCLSRSGAATVRAAIAIFGRI